MIEDLKPYPEYKDSVLPWLGEVPVHWVERRAKFFFREVDERSESGNEELMSVSHKTGVTPRKQSVTMFLAESTVGYKICRPGDIAINTMWAFMGALGIARQEGIVSPAYGVYRPIRTGMIGSEYLDKLLRTEAYKTEYIRRSTGINSSRLRLYPDQFLQIPFLCPPPDEQSAIARFLAWATNRLDSTIGAKRRIIALLQEQKQAIIHRAVTRGLDPSVPLKDSGIPWLGEIPEPWEVRRLKDVATVQTGITLGKDYGLVSTTLYPYLRVANVQSDRLDLRNVKHFAVPEVEAKRSILMPGDVLMTEGGDIDKLGRGCLWSGEVASCLHQNHVFAVRCGARLIPGFLVALMGSTHGRSYFQTTAKQTTNLASTNSTTLKAFPLLLPEYQEQQQILSFIDGETGHLSRAITDTEREITLLREYRTRLISDVVTGKLDVREVAKGLPEEALLNPLDDEPLYDGEETEDTSESDPADTPEE